MTDAPEKIWTTGNERTGSWNAEEVRMKAHMPDGWQTEYTRSDIADTLRAEVARLKAEAEVMEAWLSGKPSQPPHTGRTKSPVQP
jgi:hypothetical protein